MASTRDYTVLYFDSFSGSPNIFMNFQLRNWVFLSLPCWLSQLKLRFLLKNFLLWRPSDINARPLLNSRTICTLYLAQCFRPEFTKPCDFLNTLMDGLDDDMKFASKFLNTCHLTNKRAHLCAIETVQDLYIKLGINPKLQIWPLPFLQDWLMCQI